MCENVLNLTRFSIASHMVSDSDCWVEIFRRCMPKGNFNYGWWYFWTVKVKATFSFRMHKWIYFQVAFLLLIFQKKKSTKVFSRFMQGKRSKNETWILDLLYCYHWQSDLILLSIHLHVILTCFHWYLLISNIHHSLKRIWYAISNHGFWAVFLSLDNICNSAPNYY